MGLRWWCQWTPLLPALGAVCAAARECVFLYVHYQYHCAREGWERRVSDQCGGGGCGGCGGCEGLNYMCVTHAGKDGPGVIDICWDVLNAIRWR